MSYLLSNRSKDNRKGVDPRLIEIDDLAIQITLVDYGHGGDAGVRFAERQHELFKEGKSRCDGYDDLSEHQIPEGEEYGKALDFYAYVDGKASWNRAHLAMVACAYFQAAAKLGYKIEWGGLWKSSKPKIVNGIPYGWDCPHIQIID